MKTDSNANYKNYDITVELTGENCTHSELNKTGKVAATTTAYGCKAYYTCKACEKHFSDKNGTNEITDLESWKNDTAGGRIAKLLAFTVQPVAKAYYYEGTPVSFKAEAIGGEDGITYQWYIMSATSTKWKKCAGTGNDTNTYRITPKKSFEGAKLVCLATDGKGTKCKSEIVIFNEVKDAPTIISNLTDMTVGYEKSVKLSTSISDAISYQWYYMKKGSTKWGKCTAKGNKSNEMIFNAQMWHSDAKIRCVIIDSNGIEAYSEIKVLTVKQPVITKQTESGSVNAGDNISVSVEATGTGELHYQWYIRKADDSGWSKCTASGSDTANMSFKASSKYNGRKLICVVTDDYSSTKTEAITIEIK